MPAFDFPFETLETYKGTNPCPSDFDAYWERALGELSEIVSNPQLEPCHTTLFESVDCYHLRYRGVRNATIYTKYLKPKNLSAPAPTILIFHGYSASSADWIDLIKWTAEGFCVAAMDCRGQGGLSEDTGGVKGNTLRGHIIRGLDDHPDNLLFRHIYLDTVQLARTVASFSEVDETRLFAHGGSQGGALTLACAALEPKIVKAAAIFPFLSDYQRVWEMDLAKNAYEEITHYLKRFDPRHERIVKIWETLGYIDVHHLAKKIGAEVLMFTGLMDQICPPSSQFAAYNHIPGKKNIVTYPDFGHENLPGNQEQVLKFFKS
ncbi:MAG: alpha/beta fold hydrolase [Verrucomicrobiota bacterium]